MYKKKSLDQQGFLLRSKLVKNLQQMWLEKVEKWSKQFHFLHNMYLPVFFGNI